MTPVLCLNCGKAYNDHLASLEPIWCHENQADDRLAEMKWRSPLDESAIEQRTVEAIASWIERTWPHGIFAAAAIRNRKWKEKP